MDIVSPLALTSLLLFMDYNIRLFFKEKDSMHTYIAHAWDVITIEKKKWRVFLDAPHLNITSALCLLFC